MSMYILEMFQFFVNLILTIKKKPPKTLLKTAQKCKRKLKVHSAFPTKQTS